MATHINETSGKEFQFEEATLYIRESKTGVPREIPCNAGKYFIRWRKFCDQYRREQGLRPLKNQIMCFLTLTLINHIPTLTSLGHCLLYTSDAADE